jgi:hypothetical protein
MRDQLNSHPGRWEPHSVLNTFVQAPVSGEETKSRFLERIAGLSLFYSPLIVSPPDISRCSGACKEKDPAQYLLTVGQMVENGSPVHSYLADVATMPNAWIETLQAPPDTKAESTRSIARRHVLCVAHSIVEEMFCA